MTRWLCKTFGHRWHYHFTRDTPMRVFRSCARCGTVYELHDRFAPAFPKGWFRLVEWTAKGAEQALGREWTKEAPRG